METIIEPPTLDDFKRVNEENKNAISVYEKFGFKVKSIAYSMQI